MWLNLRGEAETPWRPGSGFKRKTAPLPAPVLHRDAPVGVALAKPDGEIVEANRAFAAFFDQAGSLSGQQVLKLAIADDREALSLLIAKAADGAAGPIDLHRTDEPGSGQPERMAEFYASPFAAGDDKRILFYLIDVSAQKALELKFAQSQKLQAVGQLAGGVAHDFNNLLTVIIGNCEFLLMRHAAGDPSFKEINEIHQNALRAANLVGQLLAFSRKQTLQPRVLSLGAVVAELANMLRRLLREGVDLKLENQGDLWPVHADETQISNAIINLVVNARDAMPKGGTVFIRTANITAETPMALGTAMPRSASRWQNRMARSWR
ncbi:MAG: PAS domain-containing protein, partial [Alphaproteobacteria bacterium]|nr:PAS domain-containing protein [Alphaproteobacteria bacterium]